MGKEFSVETRANSSALGIATGFDPPRQIATNPRIQGVKHPTVAAQSRQLENSLRIEAAWRCVRQISRGI